MTSPIGIPLDLYRPQARAMANNRGCAVFVVNEHGNVRVMEAHKWTPHRALNGRMVETLELVVWPDGWQYEGKQ